MLIKFPFLLLFSQQAVSASDPLVKPSEDSFYTVPHDLSSPPGTILAYRPAPNKLQNVMSIVAVNIVSTYQLLYRTTNDAGQPTAAVATLMVPFDAKPDILHTHPIFYDAVNVDCSPSYILQQKHSGFPAVEQSLIASALNKGWIVLVPDYEGLDAAFGAGILAGQLTLDAIRAALSTSGNLTSLARDAKVGLLGYSGGSIAVGWAAELQPRYAPELASSLIGGAFGGLIPNLSSAMVLLNSGPFSGFSASGIIGLAKEYPALQSYIDQHLIPSKRDEFYSFEHGCIEKNFLWGGKDVFKLFDVGSGILTDDVPKSVIQKTGILGLHGVPQIPLYIHSSANDEFAPSKDTDALVAKYCQAGASIEYHRSLVSEHISEAIVGQPAAFAWLQDRYEGKAAQKGCATHKVLLFDISIESLEQLGEMVASIFKSYFGERLGDDDVLHGAF